MEGVGSTLVCSVPEAGLEAEELANFRFLEPAGRPRVFRESLEPGCSEGVGVASSCRVAETGLLPSLTF